MFCFAYIKIPFGSQYNKNLHNESSVGMNIYFDNFKCELLLRLFHDF